MKVLALQLKTEGRWESRKELILTAMEEVSLITLRGKEIINSDINNKTAGFCHGKFKANILWNTSEVFNIGTLKPGDQLAAKEVTLTVEKAGKACHSNCPVHTEKGCLFLKEILFLKVQKPGKLKLMENLRYQPNADRERGS